MRSTLGHSTIMVIDALTRALLSAIVIIVGSLPVRAGVVGIIPQSALVPSTTLYTDQVGGGIGNIVIMTGPLGDSSVGDASGRSDDGFSGPTTLGFAFGFFGRVYTSVFINNNGSVTFDNGLSVFTPTGAQAPSVPLIAPFFADVDTMGAGGGIVYLRTDIPNEVIITWSSVGYFAQNTDKQNTFQLVLRAPGYNDVLAGEGQIGFFYGSMQWEVGDASGGDAGFCPQGDVPPDCVPGAIGFGDGNTQAVVLAGSMMDGISTLVNNEHIWFKIDTNGVPVAVGPGLACSFTVMPSTSLSFDSGGGFSSIKISASSQGCSWAATGPSWISVSPSSGTGSGTVNVVAAATSSTQMLNGVIRVAGQNVLVVQNPQATIVLGNLTTTYTGNPKSVSVTTTPPGLTYLVTYIADGSPVATPIKAGRYGVSVSITTVGYPGSAAGTLTILQAAPTMKWTNPAAILHGVALGGMQLNAVASVPGLFVYSPSSGTVLAVGQQNLSVTFTPTDSTDYQTVTMTVQIAVNQAMVSVLLSNLTTIYSGNPKSVSVTTTPPGLTYLVTYTRDGSTVGAPIKAGRYGVSVSITTVGYPGSAAGTLTILQAAPTVKWANPAAIAHGVALGGMQLNAAASVPGTFVYNPSSGTVLGVGQQNLRVTFTPTDSTDYQTVTMTVQIVVRQDRHHPRFT